MRRATRTIVLRSSTPDFLERLESDTLLPTLTREQEVLALVPGQTADDPRPALLPLSWSKDAGSSIEINDLRSCEIFSLLQRTGAIFAAGDDIHYLLPSGQHAEVFIR